MTIEGLSRPEQSPADLLARQIASLGSAFRTLTKAVSLKDLAGRFCGFVQEHTGGGEVCLFQRAAAGGEWQGLGQVAAGSIPLLPSIPENDTFAATPDNGGTRLLGAQKLFDGSTLGIAVSRRPGSGGYTEDALVSLRLSATLFENAYQAYLHRNNEKELVFSLNHRLLQLNSLIDTGIEVAKLEQDLPPYRLALERAAALTNASLGSVTITRDGTVIERIAFPASLPYGAHSPGGSHISAEFAFGGSTYLFELMNKESRKGVVPFEGTDRLLLDALSRQVQASLENRFLLQQSLEKEKMERDLAVAASIQQRLLPETLPVIEGYDSAGINIPSKSVGGDYYDCIPLSDGRYALVVADVAGKGIPAALLVSTLHAYLSAYLESGMPLVDLSARLNRMIHRASTDDKFITAFFALLDPRTGSMETVNAGHNTVYWRRADGAVNELSLGGIPLGMLDMDLPYQSEQFTLGPGDRILLYTDGIPEAQNEGNELYESEVPLKDFFARTVPDKADTFIQQLIADVKRFTGNAPQADDITALYLMRR
jgi:sigma-B regulation protein RsbU (phosphoserine phosphatase)